MRNELRADNADFDFLAHGLVDLEFLKARHDAPITPASLPRQAFTISTLPFVIWVAREICSRIAGAKRSKCSSPMPPPRMIQPGSSVWIKVHVAVAVAFTARSTIPAAFALSGRAANTARLFWKPNGLPSASMAVPEASDSQQPRAPQ